MEKQNRDKLFEALHQCAPQAKEDVINAIVIANSLVLDSQLEPLEKIEYLSALHRPLDTFRLLLSVIESCEL